MFGLPIPSDCPAHGGLACCTESAAWRRSRHGERVVLLYYLIFQAREQELNLVGLFFYGIEPQLYTVQHIAQILFRVYSVL